MPTRALLFVCVSLLALGCATGRLEQDPWIEVRSESFRFVSQIDTPRTLELARGLELFRSAVQKIAGAPMRDARVPTTIAIFRSTAAYRQFAPKYSVGLFVPSQRANYALVNGGGRRLDSLETLLHEYTHFLVRNESASAHPAWFDEGFAEVMAGTRVTGEGIELGRPVAGNARLTLEDSERVPLEELLRGPASSLDTLPIYYAKAWRLVHYLLFGQQLGFPERQQQLARYLELVDGGASPEQACQEAFGVPAAGLEGELERYMRKGVYPGRKLPREWLDTPVEPTVRPLDAGEVALLLGEIALATESPARAETYLRAALARRPDDARAHFGLADALRFQEHAAAEYEPLYARGLELAPDSALGQLDQAQYLAQRAEQAAEPERARLKSEVRAHLERALALDPELPETHVELGRFHLRFPEEDEALALPHLLRAHALLASDFEIDYLLATVLLRAGMLGDAQRFLMRARVRAHGVPEREEKLARLEQSIAAAREGEVPPVGANP